MHKRYYTDDQSQIQALCNMDYVLFQSYLPIYLSNMSFSYETHLAAASEKIKKTLEKKEKILELNAEVEYLALVLPKIKDMLEANAEEKGNFSDETKKMCETLEKINNIHLQLLAKIESGVSKIQDQVSSLGAKIVEKGNFSHEAEKILEEAEKILEEAEKISDEAEKISDEAEKILDEAMRH